jgi:hypothetical protein
VTKEDIEKLSVDELMEKLRQIQAYEKFIKEVLRIKVNEKPK